MYSKIVLIIALLVAIVLVGIEGDCFKQLAQWLKGGEKNSKVLFNVFTYEGEKLEPMEINWKLKTTNLRKLWNKLTAKYKNDTHKIEEMVLPVYIPSVADVYWITFDSRKLDQQIEEINKSRFRKIVNSNFGNKWLTESKPRILLYLKAKSEPDNEFSVKVYKAEVQAGAKAKTKLGEVKFTDVDVYDGEVWDSDIMEKVSEKWPSVTYIHMTSFSKGNNYDGTIENPLKNKVRAYDVRALKLEIEMTGEPKK